MNEKSNEKLTSRGMSEEDFSKMLEEQERNTSFGDPALEQFVRKPEKSNLLDNIVSTTNSILLFILFCIICVVSIISSSKGTMEPYVVAPIAVLSMIGIIILAKDMKKYQDENNKKYK